MGKETSDFRYNTGATKVPWAAVGENYNLQDTMEFVKFLMGGKGKEYNAALKEVGTALANLSKVSTPPGKLSMGDKVAEVEKMIDKYLGVEEGSSLFVSNCTAALELGYRYAGIGPGDEVIVPSNTFIATVAYPLSVGAKLVFADVDPVTVNIDPKDIAKKITKKTKIIVPVHIGGYPCDMDAIMKLAKKHDIVVMEDAAHGFGGEYKGRKLGTIGHFGCFSFHEVKNCTSLGEGGVFVSNVKAYRGALPRRRFQLQNQELALQHLAHQGQRRCRLSGVEQRFGHRNPGDRAHAAGEALQQNSRRAQARGDLYDQAPFRSAGHSAAGSRKCRHEADLPSLPASDRPQDRRRRRADPEGET